MKNAEKYSGQLHSKLHSTLLHRETEGFKVSQRFLLFTTGVGYKPFGDGVVWGSILVPYYSGSTSREGMQRSRLVSTH